MTGCQALSRGLGRTSFSEVLSLIGSQLKDLYHTFITGPRQLSDLQTVFMSAVVDFQYLSNVSPAMSIILFQTTSVKFKERSDNARTLAIVFSICTAIGLIVGATACWYWVILPIFSFEGIDKIVLQLVPIKVILANRYLKQYLLQNSGGVLEVVRSILQ